MQPVTTAYYNVYIHWFTCVAGHVRRPTFCGYLLAGCGWRTSRLPRVQHCYIFLVIVWEYRQISRGAKCVAFGLKQIRLNTKKNLKTVNNDCTYIFRVDPCSKKRKEREGNTCYRRADTLPCIVLSLSPASRCHDISHAPVVQNKWE